jgi:peptidyl-prolyl cis-trans isomerase D
VEKVIPAHVQPLEEVRAQATQFWMQRELGRALEAKATQAVARLKKGEPIDAVAAATGGKLTRAAGLSRATAQQHADLGREVLGRAFGSKAGEAWYAGTQGGIAVGQVSNIRMDVTPQAAGIAEAQRRELTMAIYREFDEAAHGYSRKKLKVRVDAARARQAAGFEPLDKDSKKK